MFGVETILRLADQKNKGKHIKLKHVLRFLFMKKIALRIQQIIYSYVFRWDLKKTKDLPKIKVK